MNAQQISIIIGVTVMLSTTVLFALTWIIKSWRDQLYFKDVEVEEVYSMIRAYYSHPFKALCHGKEVAEVRNLNNVFKTLDKMTKKYNLPITTGFFTALGDYHLVSVDRVSKNKYIVCIYDIDDDAAYYTITPIEQQHYMFEYETNNMNDLIAEAWEHLQTDYVEWLGE